MLPAGYRLSTNPGDVPLKAVVTLLRSTPWAEDMSVARLRGVLPFSLVVTVLHAGGLAGFARVVSDRHTFAYLTDVVVHPAHRGQGLAKAMTATLLDLPDLAAVNHWALLAANDEVKTLYGRFGFARTPHQHAWMERHHSGSDADD